MKTLIKCLICVILTAGLMYTPVAIPQFTDTGIVAVAEAATVKLNKKSANVYVGNTVKLKVSGTSKKVKWTTSNKSIATVSSSGLVTAKKVGTATIKAKVGGKILSCKIAVKAVPKLNYNSRTVYVGKKTQLKLTGYKIGTVKWTTSNKSIATVSSKGLVTAKKAGTATIKATVGGKTLTFKAVVKNYPELNKTKVTTFAGSKKQLSLVGTKIGTVTWTSSNKSVATVSSKGLVTAKKPGVATISATVGGKSLNCKVTVTSSMKSEYPTIEMYEDDYFAYMWITYYGDGTIYCESSDEDIVSADWYGDFIGDEIMLDLCPFKAGTAYITITNSTTDEQLKIKVIVLPSEYDYDEPEAPEVSSVTLNKTSITMNTGDTYKLTAAVEPYDADYEGVEWTSSNTKAVTVDSDGNVKAIAPGSAKITAKAGDKSATCTVTVKTSTYKIGETWEVEGNWRFKVNSITEHYKCNSTSDKTGAQVVVVDYTFWCDGPTYTSDGKLNFNGMDFAIYDENGAAGSTYPCTHDKLTTSITAGKMCNGTQTFILPSSSDTVTLEVEEYDSDFVEQYAAFELQLGGSTTTEPDEPAAGDNVAEQVKLFQTELKQYGKMETTSTGNVLYKYEGELTAEGKTMLASVMCGYSSDWIEFKWQYPVNDPTMMMDMVIYGDSNTVEIQATGWDSLPYMGDLKTDRTTYSAGKNYTFTAGAANCVSDSELQSISNSSLDLAISSWQYLLSQNIYSKMFTLNDFGFKLL